MHLIYAVLLASAILQLIPNVVLASAGEPTVSGMNTALYGAPIKRLLRAPKPVQQDNSVEERAAFSGLAKLKQAVSGFKNNQKLNYWLRNQKSIDDAFTKLKLDTLGPNLLKKPKKLEQWIKYRRLYNSKNGIEDSSGGVTFLLKYYKDEDLSELIERARRNKGTASIANELRLGQLDDWLRKEVDPKFVFDRLHVKGTTSDDVNRKLYRAYLDDFNNIYVLKKQPQDFRKMLPTTS
ncbi:unnamed protein product [Phytophthora lilii]|uniref:RxLR effector protein n=1 Tax=Phytophthora lilii TaxID=2077276 RepID=A0A9W7CLM3_9STRA|nr:unnamed protein product [Phytophthora lilii]